MTEPSILENEQWKKVLGYEGIYEISSLGRVRRIWKRGYRYLKPSVNLSKGGKQESIGIHILLAESFRATELDKAASPRIRQEPDQPRVNVWNAVFGEAPKAKCEPEPEPETEEQKPCQKKLIPLEASTSHHA